mmetsp:Transcript_9921/g.12950  ORF Transcript_9921/g.12950 Transcript_9921/m.12950 type:complete len:868 (-) Transcript_9921:1082-3685(-)
MVSGTPEIRPTSKEVWRRAYWKLVAVSRFAKALEKEVLHQGESVVMPPTNKIPTSLLSGTSSSSPKVHVVSPYKKIETIERFPLGPPVEIVRKVELEEGKCEIAEEKLQQLLKDEGNVGIHKNVEKNYPCSVRARKRWRVAVLKVRAAQRFAKGNFCNHQNEKKTLKRCMVYWLQKIANDLNRDTNSMIHESNDESPSKTSPKLQDLRRHSLLSVMPEYSVRDSLIIGPDFQTRAGYKWEHYQEGEKSEIAKEKCRVGLVPKQLLSSDERNEIYGKDEDEDEEYGECHVVRRISEIGFDSSESTFHVGSEGINKAVSKEPCSKSKSIVSISDFEPIKVIGSGSSGQVYLVTQKESGKKYAMKVLNKMDALKRNRENRVMAERDVLCSMHDHKLITTLRYAFHTPLSKARPWKSHLFFVMEYCSGGNLHEMMIRQHQHRYKLLSKADLDLCLWNAGTGNGLDLPFSIVELKSSNIKHSSFGLPFTYVQFILAEVTIALLALHRNGFVFRDLKPQNVLLHGDGHIRLGDFGVAKQGMTSKDSNIEVTLSSRSFVGTMEYMAPEMVTGSPQSSALDWWSLGILAYELVFGQSPFSCARSMETKCKQEEQKKLFFRIMTPEKSVHYPQPSPCGIEVVDLIRALLVGNPNMRLCGNRVKSHPFFEHICWESLSKGRGFNEITSTGFYGMERDYSPDKIKETSSVQPMANLFIDVSRKKEELKKPCRPQGLMAKGIKSLHSAYKNFAAPFLPKALSLGCERSRREVLGLPVNESSSYTRGMTTRIAQAPLGTYRILAGLTSRIPNLTKESTACNLVQAKRPRRASMYTFCSGLTDEENPDTKSVRYRSESNFEGFSWCEKSRRSDAEDRKESD